MPLNPNVKICSHIKVTGIPCGSPALRGEKFCYFHERMIHGVPTPSKSRIHPMALIENEEAVQVALMETINAVVRNQIDLQRANLIIRALSIAVRNSRRVRFDRCESDMVRKLPEPEPAPAHPKQTDRPKQKDESPKGVAERRNSPAPHVSAGKAPEYEASPTGTAHKPPARATSAVATEAQTVNANPRRE